mgnify:CR=1 FL=1
MTHYYPLSVDDVLEVHAMILPSAPVRDEGALISAVNKPWASYEGIELYRDLPAKAAALLIGIARNHAFLDANKRTAIGSVDYFLALNGFRLAFASDEEVADFVEIVAQGQVEQAFVSAWITAHMKPLNP